MKAAAALLTYSLIGGDVGLFDGCDDPVAAKLTVAVAMASAILTDAPLADGTFVIAGESFSSAAAAIATTVSTESIVDTGVVTGGIVVGFVVIGNDGRIVGSDVVGA